MDRAAIVLTVLVGLLALGVILMPAGASDAQWAVGIQLQGPAPWPFDGTTYLGVRPGATDGYDVGVDGPNPVAPPPGATYVDLYCYRPTWPTTTDWAQDWRGALDPGTSKTWADIRATGTLSGEHVLSWTIDAGGAEWQPPAYYSFWLFDEGTSPDPAGGTPHNMLAQPSLAFQHPGAGVHYFHVVVYSKGTYPPTCDFTWAPATPAAGETVTFDGSASADSDGTVVDWHWDFGDGGAGDGVTVAHTYTAAGDYTVALTVTDDDGLPATCQQTVPVAPGTCVTLPGNCWHLITIPCIPANPDPWELFHVLRPPDQPIDLLSGNLHRYDRIGQGYATYYNWAPSEFGPITPGDGYWLWLFDDATICYESECPGAAQSLYFPAAGWYLMGSPQPADVHFDSTQWYQGVDGPHPFGAIMDLWVQDPLIGYRCDWQAYFLAGVKGTDDDHYLRAFNGYWMYAFEGDVTLEVPQP